MVAFAAGCSTDTDAVDELHRHTEAITGLIEKHRDDPRAAIAAIEAYEDAQAEDLAELGRRSRKIRADLGQRSKRRLDARWKELSPDIGRRLQALTESDKR